MQLNIHIWRPLKRKEGSSHRHHRHSNVPRSHLSPQETQQQLLTNPLIPARVVALLPFTLFLTLRNLQQYQQHTNQLRLTTDRSALPYLLLSVGFSFTREFFHVW